jgi:hypothetical protein
MGGLTNSATSFNPIAFGQMRSMLKDMTDDQEFRRRVAAIEAQQFSSNGDGAMAAGLHRAEFLEQKFRQLISLAKNYPQIGAVKEKLKIWERGIERSKASQARFRAIIKGNKRAFETSGCKQEKEPLRTSKPERLSRDGTERLRISLGDAVSGMRTPP